MAASATSAAPRRSRSSARSRKTALRRGARPRESRRGDTRRPLERILRIHRAIQSGRHPNCTDLAKRLEISSKTVNRDIQFMREDMGLPIAYDDVKHGYYYTRPTGEFPFLKTTAEDLVALIVARHALTPLSDTPLACELRSGFRRLLRGFEGLVSIPWPDLEEAFSVRSPRLSLRTVNAFDKIARAVIQQVELKFEYTKLGAARPERRRLRPYHLTEIDGGWYVIGHDVDRGAKRTFAVQRMKALSLTKASFSRPADFRLEDHFAGSFGVWTEPDPGSGQRLRPRRVRLRFTGFAARFVPERRWHPSQETVPVDRDGETVEMRLELSAFQDLIRWILGFGGQVEVLEPPDLRNAVAAEIEAAARHYRE